MHLKKKNAHYLSVNLRKKAFSCLLAVWANMHCEQ